MSLGTRGTIERGKKRKLPSRGKAKEMMHHGEVHGEPLTPKQEGLMGLLAGGGKPSRKRGFKG